MSNKSYGQVAFALDVLSLLSQKPRSRQDLVETLSASLDDAGYAVEDLPQKLTRMVSKLRDCGFDIHSAPNRPYELVSSSFPVILTPSQRQALAMAAYFLSDMGFSAEAADLANIANLDSTDLPKTVRVSFSPPADYSEDHLNETVQKLQERFHQRRRYSILYRSRDEKEQNWDCDRSELRLHNGVLYLFAHTPDKKVTHHPAEKNMMFRLDRIISIRPASQTPWGIMEFPKLTAHYRMMGALSNYKPRRGNEREVDRDPSGKFVEIATEEDYLFGFRQRILQYGESAQVIQPKWFAQQLKRSLHAAYLNYGE